jgi:hypothetical protein
VVLTQMVVLTPEEKALAKAKLREAHQEYERREHGGAGGSDRAGGDGSRH